MDTVSLAGRTVRRLGMSAGGLRTTGMWGEPAGRADAVAAIRRAVELGVDVVEVPVPFGPAADLFREAAVPAAFVAARVTGARPDIDAVVRRLGGRAPDLLLAEAGLLDRLRGWPGPVGAVVTPASTSPTGTQAGAGGAGIDANPAPGWELAAVRGPYPAEPRLLGWCERHGIPYMAASTGILAAGRLTVALPAARSAGEVERLFGGYYGATSPAGGPG